MSTNFILTYVASILLFSGAATAPAAYADEPGPTLQATQQWLQQTLPRYADDVKWYEYNGCKTAFVNKYSTRAHMDFSKVSKVSFYADGKIFINGPVDLSKKFKLYKNHSNIWSLNVANMGIRIGKALTHLMNLCKPAQGNEPF